MANENRLIDANALCENIKKQFCEQCKAQGKDYQHIVCSACNIDDALLEIEDAPTVDAVEVVHGRWIQDQQSKFEHRYNCSACNYRLINEPCNYCPNCGAKMDGGNDDGRQ